MGSGHRLLRTRFQVSTLGAWSIIVCLSLDEMDKKGDFTHMLKRWQDEVLSLFELVFRQKSCIRLKGKRSLGTLS